IDDIATLGGRRGLPVVLALRAGLEFRPHHGLQVAETHFDGEAPQSEHAHRDDEASLQPLAPVGSRWLHRYRRATTEDEGGSLGTTLSMTIASSFDGATSRNLRVASASIRLGDRSVSIASRSCRAAS